MNPEQQTKAQEFLLHIKSYADNLRAKSYASSIPQHVCIHLAPDMCWLSIEHEYQKEDLCDLEHGIHDYVEFCERQPPACHIILTKL